MFAWNSRKDSNILLWLQTFIFSQLHILLYYIFYIAWDSVISYYIVYDPKVCGIFDHIYHIVIIVYLSVLHLNYITFCLVCLKSAIIFHLNIIFYHTAWNYNKKYNLTHKHVIKNKNILKHVEYLTICHI